MKRIALLGSTGSIGRQTLDVVRAFPEQLKIASLVAYKNVGLLKLQQEEFHPQFTALIEKSGKDCLTEAVQNCDVAVIATRGTIALECAIYCQKNGIDIALANKETVVCGGELLNFSHTSRLQNFAKNSADGSAKTRNGQSDRGEPRVVSENDFAHRNTLGKIIPVDSEHSAIMQCLAANPAVSPSRILLTASGGPFWNTKKEKLPFVTPEQALLHPNWSMGEKITVDSATMMNKSLEVLEASFLFDMPVSQVEIVVHRQSIVHSMVEFSSGSVIAQMALPNMRLPIQLALLGEGKNLVGRLNFSESLNLCFEKCDFEKFPCARLGYEAGNYPPLCRTVMNAANDICVENFLRGKLRFDEFYSTIVAAMEHFAKQAENEELSVENIEKFDASARVFAQKYICERM